MKNFMFFAFLLPLIFFGCKKENDVPITEIKLQKTSIYIKVGGQDSLAVFITPSNATNKTLTVTLRNPNVATFLNGKITGLAIGQTYIIFNTSDGLLKDSCQIFVSGLPNSETIIVGPTYANDVYYSMATGVVATVPRINWDIAFNTGLRSSTIIINAGAKINLYTYKGGDTTAWNSVNIAGIANWTKMYNSDTTWTFGAFERNALGHPDYGWGIYNSINHDVIGDSLFIIQLQDGTYKKLWIKKKASTLNKYIFQIANADNTGSVTLDTVDCSKYTAKNFIYYSFAAKNVVDREPAKDAWDFVYTKYYEMIPDLKGVKIPYPVTGVLTNTGVKSAQLDNVEVTSNDYSTAKFVTAISEIGSDWKSFDQANSKWSLVDKRIYFVQTKDNSIYKIVFTGFEGSATGVVKFDKTKIK